MERDPEIGIEPDEGIYKITFAEFFAVSLEYAYSELIKAMPEALSKRWTLCLAR